MDNTKNLIKSKTFWGIVVAVLPTVLRLAGIPIPPGVEDAIVGVGAALGVYGRVSATQRVTIGKR